MKSKKLGLRFDKGKSRVDLIPTSVLVSVGEVFKFGAEKYNEGGDINWIKGMLFSKVTGPALRHIYKFQMGQDYDEESGLCHIDHAITNLMMLKYMFDARKDLDDRWEASGKKAKGTERNRVRKGGKQKAQKRVAKSKKATRKSKQNRS